MANLHLQSLMQKQVSRQGFLAILSLAAISILGFGHLLKLLSGKSLDTRKLLQDEGYGASSYGGSK